MVVVVRFRPQLQHLRTFVEPACLEPRGSRWRSHWLVCGGSCRSGGASGLVSPLFGLRLELSAYPGASASAAAGLGTMYPAGFGWKAGFWVDLRLVVARALPGVDVHVEVSWLLAVERAGIWVSGIGGGSWSPRLAFS